MLRAKVKKAATWLFKHKQLKSRKNEHYYTEN